MTTPRSITIAVDGMSCASCVARVEKALKGADGVTSANANLAGGTATVGLSDDADTAAIVAALNQAGYPAHLAHFTLDIDGMSCASCVGRVERALVAVPGVVAAAVNLASGTASVRILDGAVDAPTVAAAATAAGYRATPQDDPDDATASHDERMASEATTLRRDVVVAAVLATPVFLLAMGGHVFPSAEAWLAGGLGHDTLLFMQFALTAAVLAGPGRHFYQKGVPALLRAAPDMNSLVALGTAA